MTRRAAAATTAGPPGPRSSASGRRTRPDPPSGEPAAATAATAKPSRVSKPSKPSKPSKRSKESTTAAGRVPTGASAATPAMAAPATEAPRRTRAKRGHGDQLREQILDATYELLIETGNADKVSTRAVAQRVGCSSPALYLHFPDRAALLWATCNRQFQRLADLIAAAVAGVDDPVEALRAAGRAYIAFGVEHAEEYRVMMMVPGTVVWNPPVAELAQEAGFDILLGLIEQGMADGQLRADDPTMVAITVWSTVHGVVAIRVAKPTFEWPPLDDHIDRTLAMLLQGLAPAGEDRVTARNGGRPSRSRRSAGSSSG